MAIAAFATPSAPRLTRLDGLRGLAACGVAFGYHAAVNFVPAHPGGIAPLVWLRHSGWTLVDLFFVLSGYVFAHVYCGRNLLTTGAGLGDFAVARFARLYPLHLVALVAMAVIDRANPNNTLGAFAAHLAMLQAWHHPVAQSFVGPAWSISVEIACYTLFAMAARVGSGVLRITGAFAMAWGLYALLRFGHPGGPWDTDIFWRGWLGFFLGVELWRQRQRLARVPGWCLVLMLAAGLAIDTGPLSPLPPLVVLAWPAALLLALRSAALDWAPMQWLGDRSYSIYLLHMPAIRLIANAAAGPLPALRHAAIAFPLAVGLSLALAAASFALIERPARRQVRAWWASRNRADTIAALA